MIRLLQLSICLIFLSCSVNGQQPTYFDDFEGNSNITNWAEDACDLDQPFANTVKDDTNPSDYVMRYHDKGGQYANIRFSIEEHFDLASQHEFSLMIYVPSKNITGNAPNQISLEMEDCLSKFCSV